MYYRYIYNRPPTSLNMSSQDQKLFIGEFFDAKKYVAENKAKCNVCKVDLTTKNKCFLMVDDKTPFGRLACENCDSLDENSPVYKGMRCDYEDEYKCNRCSENDIVSYTIFIDGLRRQQFLPNYCPLCHINWKQLTKENFYIEYKLSA